MMYCRVVPRDLFNEAKLFNNLGRLIIEGERYGIKTEFIDEPIDGFEVCQDQDDGHIYSENLLIENSNNRPLTLSIPYNCKESKWPLMWLTREAGYRNVFTEEGELTAEFIKALAENDV